TAPRSCSIDAAHPVDGDLFHQELVDVLFGHVLDVLGVLVLSQHPDLLWAKAQPNQRQPLPELGGGRPRTAGPRRCLPPSRCTKPHRPRTSTTAPSSSAEAPSGCSGSRRGHNVS